MTSKPKLPPKESTETLVKRICLPNPAPNHSIRNPPKNTKVQAKEKAIQKIYKTKTNREQIWQN